MFTDKKSRLPVKEMLFIYLAISKGWYWFNVFARMEQRNLANLWDIVVMRFLNQDAVIIALIIAFVYLDKFISRWRIKHNRIWEDILLTCAGYVAYIGIIFVHRQILLLVRLEDLRYWSIRAWMGDFVYFTIGYFAVAAMISLKLHFKDKEKAAATPAISIDDKLAMLKALYENGVLTQDELDVKVGKLR